MTIRYIPLRIVTALMLILMGVSMQHLGTLFILLLFGQILLLGCRVPVRQLWLRLRLALPFIVFSALFFSIYENGEPLPWPFQAISLYGLQKALLYSARLLFTVQVLTLLFFQITLNEFFQSLIRLKIPGIFIELLLFTLRFTDVLRTEAVRMLQALRSRGMKRGRLFSLSGCIVLSRLLGNLLLRSLHRSERIYMGMMSRGYRGVPLRRELPPFRFADGVVMLVWLLPAAAALILERR